MATLQEQFDKAERDKKAAQERMTKLRKKIQQQEAREQREKEKRERKQLLATQQEVGAFVLDYLFPWLDSNNRNKMLNPKRIKHFFINQFDY